MSADLSISGYQRRLAALRFAIRYRNPETGRRHYCHDKLYRAAFIRGVREIRTALARLGEGK